MVNIELDAEPSRKRRDHYRGLLTERLYLTPLRKLRGTTDNLTTLTIPGRRSFPGPPHPSPPRPTFAHSA